MNIKLKLIVDFSNCLNSNQPSKLMTRTQERRQQLLLRKRLGTLGTIVEQTPGNQSESKSVIVTVFGVFAIGHSPPSKSQVGRLVSAHKGGGFAIGPKPPR